MNRTREDSARRLMILLALIVTLTVVFAGASMPALSTDGWHAWQVSAVEEAPDWCCLSRNGRTSAGATRSCSLDTDESYVSGAPARSEAPRSMRVYARVENGVAVELRAFSATCAVSAADGIVDHGVVETDDSARWLAARVVAQERPVRGELAALAVHAGDVATRRLRQMAANGPGLERRKETVFWIGQVRARTMRADLRARMFDDADAKMREHAAFSWSQSNLEDRGQALIELARRDADTRVRGQAWFWLGQTGDAQTEAAILLALRTERSAQVREQAVFSLSQLRDGRSAAALIEVIEDQALAAGERERAVFWLAQDSSQQALEYLARVLE